MRNIIILSWTVYCTILIAVANGKTPNKIIGGTPVEITAHRHQVSIQYLNVHLCGGSIIGIKWALTSASCVSSEISNNFHATFAGLKILSGTADLFQDGEFDSRMLHNVNYIIHHERYNVHNFFKHDLAMLKVTKSFISDSFRKVAYLSLAQRNRQKVHITGWGETLDGHITRKLQYLELRTLTQNKCTDWYELSTTQECVSPRFSLGQIRRGNGGSAVMKEHKIAGVLSVINSNPKIPSLYTRMIQYYDWVEDNIYNYF